MLCDCYFERIARLHRIALVTRSDPGVHGERWDLSSVRETSIARSLLFFDPGWTVTPDHTELRYCSLATQ
jgi:hypothetical protein